MAGTPSIPGLDQLPAAEKAAVMSELNRLQLKDRAAAAAAAAAAGEAAAAEAAAEAAAAEIKGEIIE
ncbi:uncharacterized protein EMH_0046930 [Eimeria mitis]|uniref:Uncharacterized protein n=1 Tax=Eimeria mitis TaxID=44415 RepID=U6K017_9EIME|nr:uncharacterized protein EMH_0046930 [Eimeria mitis]CDJ29103.1 hypothetical protein EMH_0046930 [Eimeria mitis]